MEEFEEEQTPNKTYSLKDVKLLKAYVPFVKPYLVPLILLILLDIVVNICFTAEALMLSKNLDVVQAYLSEQISYEEALRSFLLYACLDIGMLLTASVLAYLVNFYLRKVGQKIVCDIRESLFNRVLSLSQKQLKSMKIGSFVTRITNDSQNLSTFFSDILPVFVRNVAAILIILILIFTQTGWFGFFYLAYLPIVFLISYFFRKKARKYYLGEKNAISKMNSFLSESFSGIRVTKTYNREDKKQREFEERNRDIYSHFLHSQDLFAAFFPLMYFLQMSCLILVCGFAIPAVYQGSMSYGTFYLLINFNGQYFQPIQQLASLINNLQSILSSAERCQLILAMEPETEHDSGTLEVDRFQGKVEFRHVYFRYEDGSEDVLKDVSFVIYPGKTVAFVGATGAGKSTIISLITRTYEVRSGQILIDDHDIHEYTLSCLRHNIGLMMQDVFLFSGTIEDNITLGDTSVSREEVREKEEFVGLSSLVDALPQKEDTPVTERGENFSAGQRQLISFARTLCYHPSLMLLDEATANIDTETENIIEESLEKMRSIGTLIIVAHRLSTIKNADHIFVVSHGQIIEEGNHQELLKQHGVYFNLYELQSMERKLDHHEPVLKGKTSETNA
ncbi:MAG: ABC transporter ATP-binding protein [Erysipelotrichaceae bacterium]|nr:ABC transporter ATP-binding protein [Erysipelotrichaceae bacterium]